MPKFTWPLISVVIGLCVAVVLVGWKAAIWQKAWATVKPRPENLTELYFTDHLNLPKVASVGGTLSFSFTVHNLEHKSINYPVLISVADDSNPPNITQIAKTDFTLANDDSKISSAEALIPISILTPRAKIVVTLPDQNQSIHFWVTLPAIEKMIGALKYQEKLASKAAEIAATKSALVNPVPQIVFPN